MTNHEKKGSFSKSISSHSDGFNKYSYYKRRIFSGRQVVSFSYRNNAIIVVLNFQQAQADIVVESRTPVDLFPSFVYQEPNSMDYTMERNSFTDIYRIITG